MNAYRRSALLTIAVFLPLVAAASGPQSRARYRENAVADGGVISGVVRFDGPRPTAEQLTVATKEQVCHRDPIFSEKLVVSDKNTIKWAVVSIKGMTEGKPFPDDDGKGPTLDQTGCVYRPHVVVVPRGKPLRILNSDGVLHNVHTRPRKNRPKNIAMPGMIKETKLRFRRPARVRTTCDIHTWMEAWIIVSAHPYYAVTDEKGEFKLTDVPPGTSTLELWHEPLGTVDKTVTVKSKAETRVEFTLSASH